MNYYEVALLKLNAPLLTYGAKEKYNRGDIVNVPLKGSIKEAVILQEVKKPQFKTQNIAQKTDYFYSEFNLKTAKFISGYYFSSFGEAIALFYPKKNLKTEKKEFKILNLPKLTPLQNEVFQKILNKQSSLLFGVTGSGKTEIYIHLIANILKQSKSSILLMPEIALTPQITKRIKNVFGDVVATWHSKLTKKKRQEILEKIYKNEVKIVIGARSALFLPLDNLGLIIVDEEHDDSYKSASRPRYNAKDLALYFAKELNIKVLLGSATPLVSDFYKLEVIRLKKPFISAKKEFSFISGEEFNFKIINKVKEVVKKSEQALIFVPTRANFKYLICNDCGKTQLCPYCAIGMSIHAKKRALKCHYCNYSEHIPNSCHYCKGSNLITKRQGTAEIIDILKEHLKVNIEQFDTDTITTANKLSKALDRVNNKESLVIVGTQMLSKGHDYPEITLSVITGLDFIMAIGDYRAKERAISLMHQIAGRSGRAKEASVIIQTSQKEAFLPYLKDYEVFIKDELSFRNNLYPPFKNLARVLIANKDYNIAKEILNKAINLLQNVNEIEIVGFGEAPINKVANKWRFNILLRSDKKTSLLKALNLVKGFKFLEIDMDPVEFS